MRLDDGDREYEGRLELCYNGEWGTVCDEVINNYLAFVVCKQLGLTLHGECPNIVQLAIFFIGLKFYYQILKLCTSIVGEKVPFTCIMFYVWEMSKICWNALI